MNETELFKKKPRKQGSRFSIDLPCVLDQKITDLAQEHNLSKKDIIRDAVRLLVEYDKLKKEGYETGGWRKADDEVRETVRVSIGF